MNEQCIQVSNLTKSFSGRKVVNDLSFAVNKGQVFALLGHNGAGKSTTIDLILGLKCPDEGNATILGMDAAKHRKKLFEKKLYQQTVWWGKTETFCCAGIDW